MLKRVFQFLATFVFMVAPVSASAQTLPPNNPANATGIPEFYWQAEWGTIHMNTTADGLNDPGVPSTKDGQVPCTNGAICGIMGNPKGSQISNGIKYDIKNSLLNCMSKPMPNWAFNNPWNSDTTVCIESYGLHKGYGDGHTLVYQPLWDRRSNDAREWQSGGVVGCQQQISNNCVRDNHECINSGYPDGPGYMHPVTHVFTPEEVSDLGGKGSQLPAVYYAYEKKDNKNESGKRVALSINDPSKDKDLIPGTITKIENKTESHLARLKGYLLENQDKSKFIIMDPSDFFDLKHYVSGGKYDSGYSQFTAEGLVKTYDTCPAIGLASGYGGICDPTGAAGCNLPVYKVGASTTFKDVDGNTSTYNDYSIRWSGYVKKWAVITVDQYEENVRGREDYYLIGSDLNKNPIIMITRADDYCETMERTSNPIINPEVNAPMVPDMPCIQYMQYQATDKGSTNFAFVDLFNPVEKLFDKYDPEYSNIQLYEIDENGLPDTSKPVRGSGTDTYIGGSGSRTGFVSFLDRNNPDSVYYNRKTRQEGLKAVYKANYSGNLVFDASGKRTSGPVLSTKGTATAGEYLGVNPTTGKVDTSKGAGIGIDPGNINIVRLPGGVTISGESTSCVTINNSPTVDSKVFIPTNTKAEFQSLLDAGAAKTVPGISVRNCSSSFNPSASTAAMTGSPIPTGSKSWVGLLSCDSLTMRPACNQTKMISASRYCRLENGSMGSCDACAKADEPDTFKFTNGSVGGEVMVNPTEESRCYFSAACFNNSADGCPSAGSSGGHVFCFAPDTKIKMADGTEKAIKDIKAGDEVVSFTAKFARSGSFGKAKVVATATTDDQQILKINNLKITPLHKIVLASGRAVAAQEIKVGDKLLKEDGLIETVASIGTESKPMKVYNLVLENGSDGYIANGVRVMSYPILKGMNVSPKKKSQTQASR